MNITLRAGEKLYINGAVIRIDRKATIELLNDVTFLLENHVMQVDQATTPLRQIYFAVQVALMDPSSTETALSLSRRLIEGALQVFQNPAVLAGLKTVATQVERSRNFEALKTLRGMFPLEAAEMAGAPPSSPQHAA
ncbi:MAG: flagellar biosynthesis repressor FlbT [Hyphomicrobiales bacterium]|nr:flagellar biosynthesis repressor FlbT [Hyphomicrobiales bacterium]